MRARLILVTSNRSVRGARRLLVVVAGLSAGILGASLLALGVAAPVGAAAPQNLCTGLAGYESPNVGSQLPGGVTLQEPSTSLAAASAPTLVTAYGIWNSFTCTHYQHTGYTVNTTYVYADCVGWTANLLRQATPNAWNTMSTSLNIRKGFVPTPHKMQSFYQSLVSGKKATGWRPDRSVTAISAGDVLAWAPPGTTSGGGGHSVLAVSNPVLAPGTTNQYYLVVMDSTATQHGPNDTRNPKFPTSGRNAPLGVVTNSGNGTAASSATSGLGIGTIVLIAGSTMSNTGIYWAAPRPGFKPALETVTFGAGHPIN